MSLKSLFKPRNRDDFYERYDEDASFKMPIEDIFEGIKSGNITRIKPNHYLTVDDFLETDENGVSLLEYVYKYKVDIDTTIESKIFNDIRIIEECIKHKDTLLKLIIRDHFNSYVLSVNINNNILFTTLSNGLSLMEFLIKNNIIGLYVLNGINDIRVYELLKKYGRYDAIEYLNEELLFSPYGRYNTLFEYLLNQNRVTPDMIYHFMSHTEACELCKKYNKIYLLKHARSNFLLFEFSNGLTVLDYLIKGNNADKNTFYMLGSKEEKKIVYAIIKNKVYRYLVYYPRVLFNKTLDNPEKTYLDLLLENYNKSMDMYLADININVLPLEERAKLYLKCADYEVNAFLPYLTIDMLLRKTNNVSFLEALLNQGRIETIMNVLSPEVCRNPDIASMLKLHGVSIPNAKVPTDGLDESYNRKEYFLKIKVSKEVESKLDKLKKLFEMEDTSTEEEINTLMASYRYLASKNYKYLDAELDMLISYKQRYKGFVIVRTDAKPFFSAMGQSINIFNSEICVLNHELGHALHYIGAASKSPQNLDSVLSKIRSDDSVLDKIKSFAKEMDQLEKDTRREAELIYRKRYKNYFDGNRRKLIDKMVSSESDKLIRRFEEIGYSAKDIRNAVRTLYDISEEEYIKRFEESKIKSISHSLLVERYDAYQAICDILDAIYFGKLRDKTYKTSKGEIISVPFGHGINYYNQDNSVFEEMVADYSEIIKSEKSVESIHYLRYVVGDELVDLLARFYEERVLHIEPTLSSKEVKSHGR